MADELPLVHLLDIPHSRPSPRETLQLLNGAVEISPKPSFPAIDTVSTKTADTQKPTYKPSRVFSLSPMSCAACQKKCLEQELFKFRSQALMQRDLLRRMGYAYGDDWSDSEDGEF